MATKTKTPPAPKKVRNIYERLMDVRLAILDAGLKKSGHNEYSNYDYFELSDFLPTALRLFREHDICPVTRFSQDEAQLTLVDMRSAGEPINFTSPMSTAKLTACHDIQNLGAVISYLRRYLLLTALELCEADALDASAGKGKEKKEPPKKEPPKKQENPPKGKKEDGAARLKKGIEMCRAEWRKVTDKKLDPQEVAPCLDIFVKKMFDQDKLENCDREQMVAFFKLLTGSKEQKQVVSDFIEYFKKGDK